MVTRETKEGTKNGASAESSYTCLKDSLKLQTKNDQSTDIVVLRKCGCGSVWCPVCFRMNRSKTIAERLQVMDWRFVRHVVLTIDPVMMPDPEESYLEIREKKAIPQLVHNMTRTKNRYIQDWLWLLEFHRSGHPHWHLFLEVEHEGREGMLTGDALRQYWPYGAVHEDYMHNERHWSAFTKYFGNKGYMSKDKAHQGRLPEWALKYETPIRRVGSKRLPDRRTTEQKEHDRMKHAAEEKRRQKEINRKLESAEKLSKTLGQWGELEWKEPRPYEVILNGCGSNADAMVITDGLMFGCKIHWPYHAVKQAYIDKGEFFKGVGYVIRMTELEFFIFNETFILARPGVERQEVRVA